MSITLGRYAPTNFRTFSRTHQILEKRSKVVVLPIGSKVTIAQGNSLLLQCPVHMYGKLNVKWTKVKKINFIFHDIIHTTLAKYAQKRALLF